MLLSFYILSNSSCPNSIMCACLLTLVFKCVLSLLCCQIHCPFHSMSFVLPVWLGRIISMLFSCSGSLVGMCEGGTVMLQNNCQHSAVAYGALYERVALTILCVALYLI